MKQKFDESMFNTEINAVANARDALSEVADYLDRFADVEDGSYGEPQANAEMRLRQIVLDAMRELDVANA
tara:strand:+ start:41592 stop:41801 length:210 start_codon:yes stop_codon:yes gene_type:complete